MKAYNPNEPHVIYWGLNNRLFAAPASSTLWIDRKVVKRVSSCNGAQAYIDALKKLGLHIRQN